MRDNRVTMDEAKACIINTESFQAHSIRGVWKSRHTTIEDDNDKPIYCVYSYKLLLAYYDPITNTKWIRNGKHSTTTSKHHNIVYKYLKGEIKEMVCQ